MEATPKVGVDVVNPPEPASPFHGGEMEPDLEYDDDYPEPDCDEPPDDYEPEP